MKPLRRVAPQRFPQADFRHCKERPILLSPLLSRLKHALPDLRVISRHHADDHGQLRGARCQALVAGAQYACLSEAYRSARLTKPSLC